MGWLDWRTPNSGTASPSSQEPLAGIKLGGSDLVPFGLRKPAPGCSDSDIQASREALWATGDDRIQGWRLDCGPDHKSTLFELAAHGLEADRREDLPAIPEGHGFRVAVLPITATGSLFEVDEPTFQQSIALLATTREELEDKKARIYAKKTTKKETKGQCYFCGFIDVRCARGQEVGNFLKTTNHLTRVVVLGEELTADFEAATKRGGITPQQWVEMVLRPQVLGG